MLATTGEFVLVAQPDKEYELGMALAEKLGTRMIHSVPRDSQVQRASHSCRPTPPALP